MTVATMPTSALFTAAATLTPVKAETYDLAFTATTQECPWPKAYGGDPVAQAAVAARDIKPVLKNLKAVVDDERCTLMATDLELGIRLEVRGIKVEDPGEALLPTNRVVAILRESTDEELTLEANIEACVIKGERNEFEMPGEDPAAFPDIPTFAEDKYHELTAGVLRDMNSKISRSSGCSASCAMATRTRRPP